MPQTGDGPFQRGERLTAAKLNDLADGRKLNAAGSARINRDTAGEVIQVDDAEIIFIRLTDKDTTKTPIRYSWKEVVRNTDSSNNTVWLDTTRTALKTDDYAIELNNQNLSTSDGYVYRAERSPHTGEWLFFLRKRASTCAIAFWDTPLNTAFGQAKSYTSLNAMRSVLWYVTWQQTGYYWITHSVLLDYDFYLKQFRVLDVQTSQTDSIMVNGVYIREASYATATGGFTPMAWQSEGWSGTIYNGSTTAFAWELWTAPKNDGLLNVSLTDTCTASPVIPSAAAGSATVPYPPHKVIRAKFIDNTTVGAAPGPVTDFMLQPAEKYTAPLPITNAKDEYFYITRASQTTCNGSQTWLGWYRNTTETAATLYYDSYGNFFLPSYSINYRRDFIVSSSAIVKTSSAGVQYKISLSYQHVLSYDNVTKAPISAVYSFVSDYSPVLPYTVGAKVQIGLTTSYPSIDPNRLQTISLGTLELEVLEV